MMTRIHGCSDAPWASRAQRPLSRRRHVTLLPLYIFFVLIGLPLAAGTASADATASAPPASTTAGFYLCKYKPTYFVLGVAENGRDQPTTKFQFSFRYVIWEAHEDEQVGGGHVAFQKNRCVNPTSPHVVNFGYTQKSIWKLYDDDAPFESRRATIRGAR